MKYILTSIVSKSIFYHNVLAITYMISG